MTLTPSLLLSTSDGRRRARRGSVRRFTRVCGLLVTLLSAGSFAVAAQAAPHTVSVEEQDGVYAVRARFAVAQPPSRVLAVLTDYEAIPRLVPDVKRSVVHTRSADHAIVEQEAVSRVLFFSKTVHVRLDIVETPDAVTFRDVGGRSFVTYQGAWRLTPTDTGTSVTYELQARPAFDVPEFLVKRLMKRDAGELIERLRAAMER